MRRILTFDGGGIRGLLSCVWLEALESRVNMPACGVVDTVAGTSIGAAIACAVASGIPATTLRAIIDDAGPRIFPRPWPWAGVFGPKYSPAPLRATLDALFGDALFGSLQRRTLVPVYDVAAQDAVVLDSHRESHGELSIVDVCLASAAAQTYFPAVSLTIGTRRYLCVDGGTGANNPALVAWSAEEQRHPMAGSILVSIGTGQRTRAVSHRTAIRAGAVQWVRHGLVNMLLTAPADQVHDWCRLIVEPGRYFRVQTGLLIASDALDDATRTNRIALVSDAEDYLATRGGDLVLDLVADALLNSARKEAA